jgi:hypothetical protein
MLRCTIYRQAGYVPGPWLLSDRRDNAWLCVDRKDAMIDLLKDRPYLTDLPFFVLDYRIDLLDASSPSRPIHAGHPINKIHMRVQIQSE